MTGPCPYKIFNLMLFTIGMCLIQYFNYSLGKLYILGVG